MARLAIRTLRGLLSALSLAMLFVAFLLDTGPGHATLGWVIGFATDVSVKGLSGDLPNKLHARSLAVRDAQGVWLRAEDVALDWDALAALGDHIDIARISASRIVVLRKPAPSEEERESATVVDVGALSAPRIEFQGRTFLARGSLHYVSLRAWKADLFASDGGSVYRLQGGIENDIANGMASVREGKSGVLGTLLELPGLKPIALDARAQDNAVTFRMSAGTLQAGGAGTIDLKSRSADIDVSAKAAAMHLRDDLAWTSLALDGHVHGTFDKPGLRGKLEIERPKAAGLEADRVSLDVAGDEGVADLSGTVTRLRVPGDRPDLFAATPVAIKAHADLASPTRPVDFTLSHALLSASGRVHMSGPRQISTTISILDLAPFAALSGEDVRGSAVVKAGLLKDQITVDGKLDLKGESVIARLLGPGATLALRTELSGTDIAASEIVLRGQALAMRGKGSFRSQRLDYTMRADFSDLSRLVPSLSGHASFSGSVVGPFAAARTTFGGNAWMASKGFAQQRVDIALTADGFPNPSAAQLRVSGNLDGAGVSMHADLDKSRHVTASAKWKSLDAQGEASLARKAGTLKLALKDLGDLSSFLDTKLAGSLNAALEFNGSKASVRAQAAHLSVASARIGAAEIEGVVSPALALSVKAREIEAAGFAGSAEAHLNGPPDRIAIALTSDLNDAHAASEAVLDARKKTLTISRLKADWRKQTLVLKAPATIDFAQGVSVDRFVAEAFGGEVHLNGRLAPKLAARVSAGGIPAKMLEIFLPDFPVDGTLAGHAELGGTLEAPEGMFALTGRALRARFYAAKPAADLDLSGTLRGRSAVVNATLTAGPSAHLTLDGEAPLDAGGHMKLHAAGTADLALLNPILTANGRQIRGKLAMNADITGSYAAPRILGEGRLSDGEVQDFARGAHLRGLSATLRAEGSVLRVVDFKAQAGRGAISGGGTIDLAREGLPADLSFQLKGARPIVSDLVTATLSGDVKLSGALDGALTASGKLDVVDGEIHLPERFPPEVAVLDVRRPGQAAPQPRSAASIALDVALRTTGRITVRGHGIEADLGGRIHLGGTSAAPDIGGGFEMRRGTFTFAGQTLIFTAGKLRFDGAGLRNRLDPTLDFTAATSSGGVTATLNVGGYASAPKITLSSSPDLPQDEILAHLLFQQSAKQLTPLQLAQIAQAIAAFGGHGFDPLGALRKGIGLDRLAVGSTTGGASGSETQTTVEAGKYVARNVYVGARQNLSGGTQVQVQVDLTKRLKAQATLSTGTNATATTGNAAQDNGSSVGLSYEFEY